MCASNFISYLCATMHKSIILLVFVSLLFPLSAGAQQPNNVYMSFDEYRNNKPSGKAVFELRERTKEEVSGQWWFIPQYQLYVSYPPMMQDTMDRKPWGLRKDGKLYINSYHINKVIGYELVEEGPYTYFMATLPATRKEQYKLALFTLRNQPGKM
jgi:hypothetical protein